MREGLEQITIDRTTEVKWFAFDLAATAGVAGHHARDLEVIRHQPRQP
jgi:hypothetical protein